MDNGLVHIYTGDGKGKTTSAVGLAVRAHGAGLRVLIVQFLKGMDTGELKPLNDLGIKVIRSDTQKFIPHMTQEELKECENAQKANLENTAQIIGCYDMVILDEVFGAISSDMLKQSQVLDLIREKPEKTELILTGRDAPNEFIDLADYVSDIRCVKHPYNKGICGRKGVEF